jgi:predicted unusual protein kinase regulating ubiquinone biosynthesis (AarF/ABC1/UbiB family)
MASRTQPRLGPASLRALKYNRAVAACAGIGFSLPALWFFLTQQLKDMNTHGFENEATGLHKQQPPAETREDSLPPLPDDSQARSQYDASLADQAVRLPALLFDARFWQLGVAFFSFLITCLKQVLAPDKGLSEKQRNTQMAVAVRQLLFDLGPTFIKLGQFLSVRGDILPEEMAHELALLQDRVPPFSLQQVRQTIVADLGAQPEQLFSEFHEVTLASASIGQVHRVRLKEGGLAVIKVQRPGLARAFYRDLGLMRLMARWWIFFGKMLSKAKIYLPAYPGVSQKKTSRNFDIGAWLELSDEFGHTLFSEIDYLKEGRNADRLRRAVRSKPYIRVPRVIWKYTGRHVLALEYIPGTKISQVDELKEKGFDLEHLGNLLINCYLEQFVLTGFFHADPHAGNLAVDDYGRLIIYDFGMMGEIQEAQRRALLQCVMAVVRRDPERVVESLTELGVVDAQASRQAVSRAIAPFIEYYAGRDIMDLDFQHLEADIDKVVAERSFRLPANLAYLLRAGSSLEGIARTLKPDFSFVEAVKPVMTKWALKQGVESLARSGKLLEFAEFAFSELRAAMRTGKEPHLQATETATKVAGAKNAKTSDVEPINMQAAPAEPDAIPVLPAKGDVCEVRKEEMQANLQHLSALRLLSASSSVVSIGAILWLASVASSKYGQVSLYFLAVGIALLGAIIFWKFTDLLKWSSQRLAEVERRGSGD